MKIIITGSHFTPALAVIEKLQEFPNNEVIYFGRNYTHEGDNSRSFESQILSKLGVKFIPIISGRLQTFFKIPLAFFQSLYLLLTKQPDVLLSFGGYVALPVVVAAWLLNIPIIIHEQTLIPGLTNQISSFFATKILVSFPSIRNYQTGKVVLSGNPLRQEILGYRKIEIKLGPLKELVEKSKKNQQPLIFITGGNQGSHTINQTVKELLSALTEKYFIIHQTGDSKFQDFDNLNSMRSTLKYPDHYLPAKFFDSKEIAYIFKNCSLLVCRAGINTLSEASFLSIPTLAIPLPIVFRNEQTINARYFARLGLAQVLLQKDLTAQNLYRKINQMIADLPDLQKEAQQAKQIVKLDAANIIALETMQLAK